MITVDYCALRCIAIDYCRLRYIPIFSQAPSNYLIRNTRPSSRIHPLAYRHITTLKDYYKFTFFPRTIIHWNGLPHNTPVLPILAQFSTAVCQIVTQVLKYQHLFLSFNYTNMLCHNNLPSWYGCGTTLFSHCTYSFHRLSLCFFID